MNRSLQLTDDLLAYVARVGIREHPVMAKCRQETLELGQSAVMQISPDQGAFMAMVARLIGAEKALEVGVFTGYSALAVALAMPPHGRIIACDISEEFTGHARRYWQEADVAGKIDLRLGDARETLAALEAEPGQLGSFDLAFIDADKPSYDSYYEAALRLLKPGGLIAVDNVLWNGSVIDPSKTDDSTVALRKLNDKISVDERVDAALVPIGDGVFMCRKRD